jgi:F-type H+-transporting ATPase subunit b
MEQTLNALGGLILKAIPTIFLFIIVYFYARVMLFRPLEKVLAERDGLTEGAQKAAAASLELAQRKEKEYEQKFTEARNEVYRLQEETRRKWLEEQAAQLAAARERMEMSVRQAKQQIAAEAAEARRGLEGASTQLADEITAAVLTPKAGAGA